jgi:hypothetical protein
MSPSQSATASHTLTTNGWDTVYAIYFADLNRAIAAQKTSPTSISGTSTGDDGTYVLAGTFGDWELTAGGDGENVYLRVPLTTSTLTLTNEGAPPTETKFDLVALTIEVQLQWVAASTNGQEDLTVRAASATTGQPAVSIVGVDYGTATPTLTEKGVYEALAEAWLVSNVGAFKQVFSTVVLNTTLDGDNASFQWTAPTATMYAVVDQPAASGSADAARSVFAVLCMTEGRPSPGVHEVDPDIIPAGDGTKTINSAFLISGERFLNKLLLPGLPLMFKGTPPLTSFSVATDGLSVTNAVDLQFTDQQLDNGRTVNPTVPAGDFTLTLAGALLELTLNGLYFDYTAGTKVTINHASTAALTLNTGRQFKLDLVGSRNSATVSQSDGVYVVLIVSNIAASIAAAAVGGLLSGIADAPVVAIQAGEAGEAGAAEAGVEMADLAALPAGDEDGAGNIGEEADAGADAAVQGQPGRLATFLNANWALIRKGLIALVSAGVSSIPSVVNAIIKHEADKQGDIPTLDALGAQVLAPVSWPQQQPIAPGSSLSDVLVGGQLNGAFQVALNLTLNPTPTA